MPLLSHVWSSLQIHFVPHPIGHAQHLLDIDLLFLRGTPVCVEPHESL